MAPPSFTNLYFFQADSASETSPSPYLTQDQRVAARTADKEPRLGKMQ